MKNHVCSLGDRTLPGKISVPPAVLYGTSATTCYVEEIDRHVLCVAAEYYVPINFCPQCGADLRPAETGL